MHPMLSRLAAGLGAAALLLPTTAGAEVTYLLTDVVGDANAINGQGLGDLVTDLPNDQSTPVDYAAADIQGIRYATIYDTVEGADGTTTYVVTGVEARMALGAEPTATGVPTIIRLAQEASGCSMFLQYYGGTNGQDPAGSGDIRITCAGDITGGNPPNIPEGDALDARWDAETGEVVWAFTFGTGTAADQYLKAGAILQPTNPHVRANSGPATAPAIDELYNPSFRRFRVGEDLPTS
jgi:hypothetical protein